MRSFRQFTIIIAIFALMIVPRSSLSAQDAAIEKTEDAVAVAPADTSVGQTRKALEQITIQRDRTFERYVDIAALRRGIRSLNVSLLTDVAAQFVEAERVLFRSHKSISADEVLGFAIKVAGKKNDQTSLTRLAEIVAGRDNQELQAKISAAQQLGSGSRGVESSTMLSALDTSPQTFAQFKSVLEYIEAKELRGDASALERLREQLPGLQYLGEKEQQVVEHRIDETLTTIPERGTSIDDKLAMLSAGNREWNESYDSYGGDEGHGDGGYSDGGYGDGGYGDGGYGDGGYGDGGYVDQPMGGGQGYDQQGYGQEPNYDQPGYVDNQGYDQQGYSQEPNYDQPGYVDNQGYDQPGYGQEPEMFPGGSSSFNENTGEYDTPVYPGGSSSFNENTGQYDNLPQPAVEPIKGGWEPNGGPVDGSWEGSYEGNFEGSSEGIWEGNRQGSSEGIGEGNREGSWEGYGEGIWEGSQEGSSEGIWEGNQEGIWEGNQEGSSEGIWEGIWEGNRDGSSEGSVEGWWEGTGEGTGEGTAEGTFEGWWEGTGEGTGEGTAEGTFEGWWDDYPPVEIVWDLPPSTPIIWEEPTSPIWNPAPIVNQPKGERVVLLDEVPADAEIPQELQDTSPENLKRNTTTVSNGTDQTLYVFIEDSKGEIEVLGELPPEGSFNFVGYIGKQLHFGVTQGDDQLASVATVTVRAGAMQLGSDKSPGAAAFGQLRGTKRQNTAAERNRIAMDRIILRFLNPASARARFFRNRIKRLRQLGQLRRLLRPVTFVVIRVPGGHLSFPIVFVPAPPTFVTVVNQWVVTWWVPSLPVFHQPVFLVPPQLVQQPVFVSPIGQVIHGVGHRPTNNVVISAPQTKVRIENKSGQDNLKIYLVSGAVGSTPTYSIQGTLKQDEALIILNAHRGERYLCMRADRSHETIVVKQPNAATILRDGVRYQMGKTLFDIGPKWPPAGYVLPTKIMGAYWHYSLPTNNQRRVYVFHPNGRSLKTYVETKSGSSWSRSPEELGQFRFAGGRLTVKLGTTPKLIGAVVANAGGSVLQIKDSANKIASWTRL